MNRQQRGASLVGVIVIAVVIATVAALAWAGYGYGIVKVRRSGAQACLHEAARAMDRAHAATSTYQGAAIPSCPADVDRYYSDVTFASGPTDSAYTLQISPRPGTEQANDACGRMTLDERGRERAASGEGCW